MNEATKALAFRIRLARERKGLTQTELAKLIGSSQQAVGSWEVGRQQPRGILRIARLCDTLGVSLQWLSDPTIPNLYAIEG